MKNSIVPTNINFNYSVLMKSIDSLLKRYAFLRYCIIGNSIMGKNIPALIIGNGSKQIFYNASFHANEWITSVVLMKFIEDLCIAYSNDSTIYGKSVNSIFSNSTLYIVPMVNPDGVDLVTNNLNSSIFYEKAKKISDNFPNIDFPSGWKANITGESLINFHHFFVNIMNLFFQLFQIHHLNNTHIHHLYI